MANRSVGSLADPTRLKPTDKQDGLLQVIFETPKGCRNKFAFDPEKRVFTLRAVLPAGMAFPYDFGFLPRTIAPDGDPLDVLLLMDEPAFPGVAVRARLIGVIEGEQVENKRKVRNDRLLAVADATHQYANVRRISDLPCHFLRELEGAHFRIKSFSISHDLPAQQKTYDCQVRWPAAQGNGELPDVLRDLQQIPGLIKFEWKTAGTTPN